LIPFPFPVIGRFVEHDLLYGDTTPEGIAELSEEMSRELIPVGTNGEFEVTKSIPSTAT
jgi:hypothetical protein